LATEIPPNTATAQASTEDNSTEGKPATNLMDSFEPAEPEPEEHKSKKAKLSEGLEHPHKAKDLKPWDPTFYGFMNAHDYPQFDPDDDLVCEEELPPEARRCPKAVRRLIRNCHRNLGHPSNFSLVRLMSCAKCHPDMIAYATHMKCDVCRRRAPPKRIPRATMPYRPTRFNDFVGIDLTWVKDARGEKFYLLNILDLAIGFNLGVLLKDKSSKSVTEAFKVYWLTWAGPPGKVVADQGRESFGTILRTHAMLGHALQPDSSRSALTTWHG
jgi:hypothetical protein